MPELILIQGTLACACHAHDPDAFTSITWSPPAGANRAAALATEILQAGARLNSRVTTPLAIESTRPTPAIPIPGPPGVGGAIPMPAPIAMPPGIGGTIAIGVCATGGGGALSGGAPGADVPAGTNGTAAESGGAGGI